MEIALDTKLLLTSVNASDSPAEFEISNLRFRVPCSRDLATVSGERNIKTATMKLLQQCCLAHPDIADISFDDILTEAEVAMEHLDPGADINLALTCESCGHNWLTGLDIGALLWDEIDARARALLVEVNNLARAYGWTEREILALSPQRRTAYLDMVSI